MTPRRAAPSRPCCGFPSGWTRRRSSSGCCLGLTLVYPLSVHHAGIRQGKIIPKGIPLLTLQACERPRRRPLRACGPLLTAAGDIGFSGARRADGPGWRAGLPAGQRPPARLGRAGARADAAGLAAGRHGLAAAGRRGGRADAAHGRQPAPRAPGHHGPLPLPPTPALLRCDRWGVKARRAPPQVLVRNARTHLLERPAAALRELCAAAGLGLCRPSAAP
jgi:hypothetical protein